MEYADEKIIKAKRQQKEVHKEVKDEEELLVLKELEQSIYDEFFEVYGRPVKFAERKLVDDKLSIFMPVEFVQMDEQLIKEYYYMGTPPQYVFTCDKLPFSVGFSITEHAIKNELVGDFLEFISEVLEKSGPKVSIFDTDIWEEQEHQYAGIEYVSGGVEASIFNHMFYSTTDGKLVIGFVNYEVSHVDRLRTVAQEIAKSFRAVERMEDL